MMMTTLLLPPPAHTPVAAFTATTTTVSAFPSMNVSRSTASAVAAPATGVFPLLCECRKRDGYVEHKSQCNRYVLWVLPDGRHVAFIHGCLIADRITNRGITFGELLSIKPTCEEACKMISRPFLQILGYKPDYVVIVLDSDDYYNGADNNNNISKAASAINVYSSRRDAVFSHPVGDFCFSNPTDAVTTTTTTTTGSDNNNNYGSRISNGFFHRQQQQGYHHHRRVLSSSSTGAAYPHRGHLIVESVDSGDDNDDNNHYYYASSCGETGVSLLTSRFSMPTILQLCAKNPTMEHIKTLAEGPGEPSGPKNLIGQLLTALSLRLAMKGFFTDTKYFPCAQRDMQCLSSGMSLDELRLKKLFGVLV